MKRDKVLKSWSTTKIRNDISIYREFHDKESKKYSKQLKQELKYR